MDYQMEGEDWTGGDDQKEGLLDGRGLSDGRESFDGRGLLAILYYGKCFKNMNITKHLVSFNTGVASIKTE